VGTLSLVATPGLCGNYNLTDANGTLLTNGGGAFGASESNNFCLSNGAAPRLLLQPKPNKLQVYPIIANDFIKVSYEVDEFETATVLVVDTSGRVWLKETIGLDYELTLNVNSLSSGNYFVQVNSSEGSFYRQFLKR